MNKPNSQSGIALISVLIVVALISTSVVLMLKHQNSITHDIKIVNRQANAIQYLFSLEEFAKVLLKTDIEDEKSRMDESGEDWAEKFAFAIDNGQFEAQLFDLQAGLNINNIFKFNKSGNELRKRDKPDFFGCFNRLNLLVNSDIDGYNVVNYLNRHELKKVNHPSELRKMTYIGSEDYQKIKDFLFVNNASIKININTADDKILRCLHSDLNSEEVAKNIKSGRPYESVDDLKKTISKAAFNKIKPMIDVKSDYFVLKGAIMIENSTLNTRSVFKRNHSKIELINRSYYLNNESY